MLGKVACAVPVLGDFFFGGKRSASKIPIASMGLVTFPYIYHTTQPNVGKYTIHGWYGIGAKKTCSPPKV